jgi:hypothetical protein
MSAYQTRAAFATEGTYTPDNLLTGGMPYKAIKVTIGANQTISRGHVLGQITSGALHRRRSDHHFRQHR